MSRIAIDLTPLLPGGENGGAKILILTLLHDLKKMAPQHSFILLTSAATHEELSSLDGTNCECICILRDLDDTSLSTSSRIAIFLSNLPRVTYEKIQANIGIRGLWFQRFAKFIHSCINHRILRLARSIRPRRSLLTKLGIDLLFCPFTDPRYAEPGIPTVSIVHDLQHRDYPQFFTNEMRQWRDIFLNETVRLADTLICVSEFTRRSLLDHFSPDPAKTVVIPDAIHNRLAERHPEKDIPLLDSLGIGNREYMLYPANYWPHKNHRMLLTAYRIFLGKNPDSPLNLVFTGALEGEEKKLHAAVKQMGIDNRVHFLGYLPEGILASVLQGCSFLIFPSLYEGFGIPVLEAMSLGKPVLCSNTSSLPEVAENAALLFDPRKPKEISRNMETIVSSPELAEELKKRGIARASAFRQQEMTRKYIEVFEDAIRAKHLTKTG